MNKMEIAEIMEQDRKMIDWAYKVKSNKNITLSQLDEEDRAIAEYVDEWAKKIGRSEGNIKQLAEFIRKIVEPEIYNAPDEILDSLFNKGSIGEFDNKGLVEDPVNTLNAIESGKYGNVDMSYIDYRSTLPTWRHLQIETEIDTAKLRKGGYKTVADYIVYAEEAFRNKMFKIVFDAVLNAISSGSEGYIDAGSKELTQGALDECSNFLLDRGDNPILVGLSTLIRPAYKVAKEFLTEDLKAEINKYGTIKVYNGVRLIPVNSAHKLADGSKLLPEKIGLGVADKIGDLDMRGELRVLTEEDINSEKIHLKFTGFEFGYALNKLNKVCKIVLQ